MMSQFLWFIYIFTDIMRFPENNAWCYVCMPSSMPKVVQDLWIKLNTIEDWRWFSTMGYDKFHFPSKSQNFNYFPCFQSIKNISLHCNNLWDFQTSLMVLTCLPSVGFGTHCPISCRWLPYKDNLLIKGKFSQHLHSLARNWAPSSLGMLNF